MEKQVFSCQSCRAKLNLSGLESLPAADSIQGIADVRRQNGAASSTLAGFKVDESFIFLDHGGRKGKFDLP